MARLATTPDNPTQDWIDQFDDCDKADAAFLADSLDLVPEATYRNVITNLITRQYQKGGPAIALYAIRQIRPSQIELKLGERSLYLPGPAFYFDAEHRSARPNAIEEGAKVGSEGPMANLIRDISEESNRKFLDHPSIDSLYRTKCRRILLVDDIIGSGTRAHNFVNAVFANKYLKSWHSFRYMSFSVLAYAGTTVGQRFLRKNRRVSLVEVEHHLSAGKSAWSESVRQRMTNLCNKYATRTRKSGAALGYKGIFSLLVFAHKCPNTSPAILWASGKHWRPLFRTRPVFGYKTWPSEPNTAERRKDLLEAVGQPTLSVGEWEKLYSPAARDRLALLAAVAKRHRRPEVLSEMLARPVSEIRGILKECVALGWLSWDHAVTEIGVSELAYARKLGAATKDSIQLNDTVYFPSQLRSARDSV